MGTRVPKSVSEYGAFNLDVGVCCSACGRVTVFRACDVDRYLARRDVRTTLPIDTSLFRCRCGSRAVTTIGVPVTKRPEPHLMAGVFLHPIYVMEPGTKG